MSLARFFGLAAPQQVQNLLSRRNDRRDPGANDKRRGCPQVIFDKSDSVNRPAPLVGPDGAGPVIVNWFYLELARSTRVTA
jgi:hypothetical protein